MPNNRCAWVPKDNPLYEEYHDTEWGVPVHDDRKLFEFLLLESAQAGLSWETVLKKREGYHKAFASFDPKKIATFTKADVSRLMNDGGIIRNRLKITATINGAILFLALQKEYGSFADYVWQFVGGNPLTPRRKTFQTTCPEALALAKDMKKRGFKFCGATICYAFMQATGLVNDHAPDCFRFREVAKLSKKKPA